MDLTTSHQTQRLIFCNYPAPTEKEQQPGTVTIQQRRRCAKAACDLCWFAHEQTADKADGVLLNSYNFLCLIGQEVVKNVLCFFLHSQLPLSHEARIFPPINRMQSLR